jgi:5'-deoxynucleotidase YfbR-like HD superfamily hydrolase
MDEFLATIGALKDLPRRGWVKRGVPDPESVADHMYHMAMICLTYPWVRRGGVRCHLSLANQSHRRMKRTEREL